MESKKYAIYDFCRTIVDFETADPFVDFVCSTYQTKHSNRMKVVQWILDIRMIRFLLNVTGHFFHKSLYKKFLLYKTKGITKNEIHKAGKEFYTKKIVNHLNKRVVDRISQDKKDGYEIVILSSSYTQLIMWFAKDFGIDYVIANQIRYRNGISTGRMATKDCIYKRKVKYLKRRIKGIDLETCLAYSDSSSDLPILNSCGQGYVVTYGSKKGWIRRYGFGEISV